MKLSAFYLLLLCSTSVYAQSPQAQIDALKKTVAALQTQVDRLQASSLQALAPFVKVDPNPENGVRGPNIVFTGANVHVVSGSGNSWDNGNPSGLGNLIIGYCEGYAPETANRTGIHNLVIGRYHEFGRLAWGSIVSGEENTINGAEEACIGGLDNTTNTSFSVIVGGDGNTTIFGSPVSPQGSYAQVICGGTSNSTAGSVSCIFGGTGEVQNVDNGVILGTNKLSLP